MPLLTAFLLAATLQQTPPDFLARMESAATARVSPADEPDQWLLAFVDVETTGLAPFYHEMIDVGMVVTDLRGEEVDRLFFRIQPEHPERTSPGARAVNAFDEERWRALGALSGREAVERIASFVREASADRSVLLVAFNSQFDTAFIDALFRRHHRSWRELFHYFVLDIPSMAWSVGLKQLDGALLAAALGIRDEPRVAEDHTGITGAELNLRLYRALLARISFAILSAPRTVPGVGAAQGLEWRDGRLYVYGDADTGVLVELEVEEDAVRTTGRSVRLTLAGLDHVPHPTGLTYHPEHGAFLGNTVGGKGTIYLVDWEGMLEAGTLDGAIRNAVEDDAAVNGTRPELVRLRERWLVATSDYGSERNEVRLYDPEALAKVKKTSEPGVLVERFSCGPWVQSLHWIDERDLLVLVQNQIEGLRWRLAFVDLKASVARGRAEIVHVEDFGPADELEGFHLIAPDRGFLVSSSRTNQLRSVVLHWRALETR